MMIHSLPPYRPQTAQVVDWNVPGPVEERFYCDMLEDNEFSVENRGDSPWSCGR